MITFIEFLDNIIESFEILIALLDIRFVLFREDEILVCRSHGFDGLFALFIIEVDCL